MNFDLKEIFTAFMVLFAVIDIIGNIPIIIDLRQKVGHIQSEKAALIAGAIMILFLFLGNYNPPFYFIFLVNILWLIVS